MIYSKFAGTDLSVGETEHVLLKVRARTHARKPDHLSTGTCRWGALRAGEDPGLSCSCSGCVCSYLLQRVGMQANRRCFQACSHCRGAGRASFPSSLNQTTVRSICSISCSPNRGFLLCWQEDDVIGVLGKNEKIDALKPLGDRILIKVCVSL